MSGAARRHRQPGRRRRRAAAAGGAPRRRRPLPRRGGGQGHGHASPTSPTRCRSRTASGSATRSPPAGRPATTTRPWASPRAAPGSRSSGTSASSGVDTQTAGLHRRRRRRHVRRRVRQRDAAVRAHPAGGRVRPPARLPRPRAGRGGVVRRSGSRLFDLPRSSWDDYDTRADLRRAAASTRARPSRCRSARRSRTALGIAEGVTQMTPAELMRAILAAPVDLLWNGGIGTYVKASTESNADVGDKANDAIRVDGRELRVRVVGEGGNLGLTQRGRIEAAQRGVRLNTDAIDNSAGVDTLRPRGQHQDPARPGGPRRRPDREAAQRPARVDDRRRGRARAARQLRAERPARQRARAVALDAAGAPAVHPRPGAARRARPRAGVPARPTARSTPGSRPAWGSPRRSSACSWRTRR